MSLTESLDRENKAIAVGTPMWRYQWTKAVAAMFNCNGGIIRDVGP